jgi:hypothetical protein
MSKTVPDGGPHPKQDLGRIDKTLPMSLSGAANTLASVSHASFSGLA